MNNRSKPSSSSQQKKRAIVPLPQGPLPVDDKGQLIPGEYERPGGTLKVKKLELAKHYDVISVARAMNENFAGQVKELFDPEVLAVNEAIQSGLYISWRPIHKPFDMQDCQRVSSMSRCFCGHILKEHEAFTGQERVLRCNQPGCGCKAYNFTISRPEEAGEFWLRKRRDFKADEYRSKCRCKHTDEQHQNYPPPYRCQSRGCGCNSFHSAWVCAACDQFWHLHHTVLETRRERQQCNRPVDEEWYPFSEMPDMRDIALTGVDNPNVQTIIDALPPNLRQRALDERCKDLERQMLDKR